MRLVNFNYACFDGPEVVVGMRTREQFESMFHTFRYGNGLIVRRKDSSADDRFIDDGIIRNFGRVFKVKQISKAHLEKLNRRDIGISYIIKRYSYIDESGYLYSIPWLRRASEAELTYLDEELFEL